MATERHSMRKIREILRHKWALKRSHREVAASLGVSVGAVSGTEQRARRAGLDWAAIESLSEEALETRLYGTAPHARASPRRPGRTRAPRSTPGPA